MSRLVASMLGVGYLRPAPGTWGSLAALALAFVLLKVGGAWLFILALGAIVALAYWSILDLISSLGEPGPHDPSWVVIDEVAGQLLALSFTVIPLWRHGVDLLAAWPGWVAPA